MPKIVLPLSEWRSVAHQIAGRHLEAAPPGLIERIRDLVDHAPAEWADEAYGLELDDAAFAAVRATCDDLHGREHGSAERSDGIAQAGQIVSDHQRRRAPRRAPEPKGTVE